MTNASSRPSAFGIDAEQYERARPGYPQALVDDLVTTGTERVLDVGCGTGKAGRLLADRGCTVLGVEHDARMARVARRLGLAVEVARFEDWDAAGREFDLVVSGQAWHWIDRDAGPATAARVLAPNGTLAVFWNRAAFEPSVRRTLDAVYTALEPELGAGTAALGKAGLGAQETTIAGIRASSRFAEPRVVNSTHEHRYTTTQYVDQIETHSDHRILPTDRLEELKHAVGKALDELGGRLTVTFTTTLVRAQLVLG